MTRKVKIAVIGTGRMGSVHTRNIARLIPEADLVAVCDIRLEVAQTVADELGIRRVVKDYHELLADKDIEAILIATSTNTHAFIMKDVAAAGKHIFCEKPLALELDKIDEALEAVEKAGVKLQVGFNRRFDKSFQQVRQIVASGEIGRPCILRITNRDPDFPAMEFMRVSGGMFLDMTIHDFDMARFQVGEIEEVYATGGVLIEPELKEFGDIDTNVVTLKFANGAVGAIDNSRKAVYGYDQRLEVFCSNGTAMANNEAENTAVKGNPDGFHSAKPPYFFMQRYAPCYVDEVRQFIECVRDDKPTPTTGKDGRAAVVLGYAAGKSLRENRPVKVSEIG
ncbi:MAG: inositol 2-dehydrogenase [Chloroflexi bacterium]|nr:inositol 2-dehydrogenase [Chloroflexota bacterium]MBE3040885.1 inositol 2-dehydrogenase [Chloroflexota bacterium]